MFTYAGVFFKEIKDEPDSESEVGSTEVKHEAKEEEEKEEKEEELKGRENEVVNKNESLNSRKEEHEEEDQEDRVFSENLSEMCLCECKLCGKAVYHHQIKSHNDSTHRPAKSQYDFIRQTYYRWGYTTVFSIFYIIMIWVARRK